MTIDLKPFYNPNDVRQYITKPWSLGSYTYATNGHVLIRVNRMEDIPENPENRIFINESDISIALDDENGLYEELVGLPPIEDPKIEPCKYCRGRGKGRECDECNGSGKCYHCNDGDCPECGGRKFNAELDCDECRGTGKLIIKPKLVPTKMGQLHFDLTYLHVINKLPDCKMRVDVDDPTKPVRFKFTGGCGLVMSVRV